MLNTIDRNNLESLLVNSNQNATNQTLIAFANQLTAIKKLEDIKQVDEKFYSFFSLDKSTPKFKCTSIDIFERKTYSGCSDIGLAIAPILRLKGIPTVYVESAHISWIKDIGLHDDATLMQGHIFLEIYIDNTWYLYDPTFHLIYKNYDFKNPYLPRNYIAFLKSLNCHEVGITNVTSEKIMATKLLRGFNLDTSKFPNYEAIDVRKMEISKNI